MTAGATRPWHCRGCGALLGVEHDGELHVKYKEAQYWIRGCCRHPCRRCGRENALHVPGPGAPAASLPPGGPP